MKFECRICGRQTGTPQGRGAHEACCAREKGAQIFESGENRYIILADGKRVDAPNLKRMDNRRSHKAKTADASESVAPNSSTCDICGRSEFKNLLAFTAHQTYHVRKGEARWKDNKSHGPDKQLIATKLGHGRFGGKVASAASTLTEVHPSEIIKPEISPEDQFSLVANQSFNAVRNLQAAAAMMAFSLLIEQIGPEQAQHMVSGMQKIGKTLTRR